MVKKPIKKRERLKLTPEQRKAIWKPSDVNAGAGWKPKHKSGDHDPITYEKTHAWRDR